MNLTKNASSIKFHKQNKRHIKRIKNKIKHNKDKIEKNEIRIYEIKNLRTGELGRLNIND